MNWQDTKENLPIESGSYLVSIEQGAGGNKRVSLYVAHFDFDSKKWHKCNCFVKDSVQEEISDRVIGWMDGVSTYLG